LISRGERRSLPMLSKRKKKKKKKEATDHTRNDTTAYHQSLGKKRKEENELVKSASSPRDLELIQRYVGGKGKKTKTTTSTIATVKEGGGRGVNRSCKGGILSIICWEKRGRGVMTVKGQAGSSWSR